VKVVTQNFIGTTEEWKAANPKLYNAVWGFETTKDGKVLAKLGNGKDRWNSLKYFDNDAEKFQAVFSAIDAEARERDAAIDAEALERDAAIGRHNAEDNAHSGLRRRLDDQEQLLSDYRLQVEYLVEFIKKRYASLGSASPLSVESGAFLVTESGNPLIVA
jgi:hypothetical protein